MEFSDLQSIALVAGDESLRNFHQYKISNYFWSLGTKFSIRDESGVDLYQVRFDNFIINKIFLEHIHENNSIEIEADLLRFHPVFTLKSSDAHGQKKDLGMARQKSFLSSSTWTIDSIYGQFSTEKTNKIGSSFIIKQGNELVASMRVKLLTKVDAVTIEISHDVDQIFVLALALVLFHSSFA